MGKQPDAWERRFSEGLEERLREDYGELLDEEWENDER